jgi:HlyD family secretion protein
LAALARQPRGLRDRLRIVVPAILGLVAVAAWIYLRAGRGSTATYRFATVERGNLESAVSATGTLSADTTVHVGTQVSGQVSALYVDFNDRVKKGQLIARIDPTLLEQAVRDAQAGLEHSQATLAKAERDYEQDRQLYENEVLSESDFNAARTALATARADAKSAQVALDKARRNLAYTSIYAPIDGIVVERDVDLGQTVAASLQAPQLFVIANDLSRMQILASVDESDVGQIHEGQRVRFMVQAYPDTFAGAVRQVRLQSTIVQNVVNYTVVVDVRNPQGKLLPGMTATVRFLTGSASDALLVPNAALRFRPTEALLKEVGPESPAASGTIRLWYIGIGGKPAAVRVRTGITDGQRTVIQGEGITAGMKVITAVTESGGTGQPSSPFQPSQPGRPRPRGF